MAGLNLHGGAGFALGTPVTAPAPTSAAPAVAAFGPSGTTVVDAGPGVVGSSAGHLAVYFGIGCLVALVIIRQSLPK